MGNDAPLAVLSQQPRNISDYFKQLFAQVRTRRPFSVTTYKIHLNMCGGGLLAFGHTCMQAHETH